MAVLSGFSVSSVLIFVASLIPLAASSEQLAQGGGNRQSIVTHNGIANT